MRLYKFQTKHGLKVIGGRFDEMIRTPSTKEELEAGIGLVVDSIVERAELEHEKALKTHRSSWNLEP